MSAAASRLRLESPGQNGSGLGSITGEEMVREREALERFTSLSSGPVIAVDLDDVLSQTNKAVADWHNTAYDSKIDLSLFYYYYYWKNPFWGTPKETFDKVKEFYSTDMIFNTKPVPGAREGTQSLRDMGYRLIIVTARTEDHADKSWRWVDSHFPDIFESVICTGQFEDAHKTGHEVATKLSKAQVCADLKAKLLIDDSAENAIQCATATQQTPVLLFGDYEWNKRISGPEDAKDSMSFARRLEAEGGRQFWVEEKVEIPDGTPVYRVKDWAGVVAWVRAARDQGMI